MTVLKPNERIDDVQLVLDNGTRLHVIQNPDGFCYGIDAVLLADFANVKSNTNVLDMCTGCGIIPLILSAKTKAEHITGIEIQPDVADMAQRSVKMNGLDEKISIVCGDIKNFNGKSFDTVICNPPYKEVNGGLVSQSRSQAVARTEVCCTLSDVITAAKNALIPNGSFYMIHRPERITDILCGMRMVGIEPKQLRYIHPAADKPPNLVLVRGIKGSNPKISTQKPLFVYDNTGEYTDEIVKIYSFNGKN